MEFASGGGGHSNVENPCLDQSHGSTSGFRGRFWMRPDQIFTDVSAKVAEHFLELIADRNNDFFEKLKFEIGVQFDKEQSVIRGNLEQIILTKMRMEKYLMVLEETEQHLWNTSDITIEEPQRISIKREVEMSEEDCEENSYNFPEQSLDLTVPNDRKVITRSRRKVRAPRKLTSNSESNKIFIEQMESEEPIDMIIQLNPNDVVKIETTSSTANSSDFSTENVVVKVEPDTMDSNTEDFYSSKSSSQWQMDDTSKLKDLSFDSSSKDTSSQEKLRDTGSPFEYSCELCSFKTLKEGQLLKHVLIHGKSNIMHVCNKCSFISVSLSHFNRHLLCHSENLFKCPECTFQTDEARQMTRHVTMKHTSVNIPQLPREDTSSILQCSECSYNTTKIYHFERHLLVHNRDLQCLLQVYQCDECPYKTHRKEHYHRHRKSVHVRSRPHQCNYCRRSYKTLSALREHDLAAHKGLGTRLDTIGVVSVSTFHDFENNSGARDLKLNEIN